MGSGRQERLSRNKARHRVILRLYQDAMDNPADGLAAGGEPLFRQLLDAIAANRELLETECQKRMDGNWRWSRLALLVRLILQSGAAELLVLKREEGKGRIISAYVNIARRYLEPPQTKFINAVLDKLANRSRETDG